jgi:transposase
VELFEQIRRDWRAGEVSIRELAVRHHVHRRTVRQALASAVPPPRKAYPQRPRPALDPFTQVIDEWLLADRVVPRKQRHTARRVWQRLVAEHGATPGRVRYDNLGPAVVRVLRGRDRAESERFIALRSHYRFDSFFCVPGKGGARRGRHPR